MAGILVTGASGYIGGHLLRRLLADGLETRGLVRREGSAPPGAEEVVGDITRPESLGPALLGVSEVFHCAAIVGNQRQPYPGAYDQVNRVGTENLVRACQAAGVRRIVALSGLGSRPAPQGTYMATRWGLEEAVRNSGLEYVILQPSVLFGPGAAFTTELAKLLNVSPVGPLLGGGATLFQPILVEDLVRCLAQARTDPALTNATLALGGSEILSFRQLMLAIAAALGKRRLMLPLPLAVARVQAALMQVLPNPPLTPAALELFAFDNATELDAVDRHFGFHPRGFREYLTENGLK